MKKGIYLFLALLIVACGSDDISGEDSTCIPLESLGLNQNKWSPPSMGSNNTVPFIPDYYAVYYNFQVDVEDQDQYIQITGEFPKARYMSYNIYNSKKNNVGSGSIRDNQIIPNCGSTNPFTSDDNGGTSSNYTVNIVPDNRVDELEAELDNIVNYQIDSLVDSENIIDNRLIVMLRYYVTENPNGIPYVELPSIIGKKIDMSGDLDLIFLTPESQLPPHLTALEITFAAETVKDQDSIGFWRFPSSGELPNNDNEYLVSPIICGPEELIIIKFKPPTFNRENDIAQGPQDVRYWSLNLGDRNTFTFNGIKDEDAKINPADGFCYVVLANTILSERAQQIKDKCDSLKYNYLDWNISGGDLPAHNEIGLMIYRNLVSTNFPDSLAQVKTVKFKEVTDLNTLLEKVAENFIGNYAPRGKKKSIAEFLDE